MLEFHNGCFYFLYPRFLHVSGLWEETIHSEETGADSVRTCKHDTGRLLAGLIASAGAETLHHTALADEIMMKWFCCCCSELICQIANCYYIKSFDVHIVKLVSVFKLAGRGELIRQTSGFVEDHFRYCLSLKPVSRPLKLYLS